MEIHVTSLRVLIIWLLGVVGRDGLVSLVQVINSCNKIVAANVVLLMMNM